MGYIGRLLHRKQDRVPRPLPADLSVIDFRANSKGQPSRNSQFKSRRG
jgi:hypothetical protein